MSNSIKILTKFIPYFYALPSKFDLQAILWENEGENKEHQISQPKKSSPQPGQQPEQEEGKAGGLNQEEDQLQLKSNQASEKGKKSPQLADACYGIRLIHALVRLSFMPDFTVKYSNIPWQNLQYSKEAKSPNDNVSYYQARILLLKCLKAVLSVTLFKPDMGRNFINPYLLFLSLGPNDTLSCLFLSLLAVVMKFRFRIIQPIYYFFNYKDQELLLAYEAAQVLSILVNECSYYDN